MEEKQLLVERRDNVVTLILNRPEKKNSLSPELVRLLLQSLQELAADASVRAVVIRGSGSEAFCSGYDIRSLPAGSGNNVHEKLG